MNLKLCWLPAAVLAMAAPVWAGPPLICHPIQIGDAKSLPWRTNAGGWNGTVRSYDASAHLINDTLALLAPGTPLPVRMETMRRAAVYAARAARLPVALAERLEARANAGNEALAWFDAGYWIETVRQAAVIYQYDMLTPAEKTAWQIREGMSGRDGYPMVKKAIERGGSPAMAEALEKIGGYRKAD